MTHLQGKRGLARCAIAMDAADRRKIGRTNALSLFKLPAAD
jgi:hypothetical protein